MHTWICLLVLQARRRLTESCHVSTSLMHVIKMMLTGSMPLGVKGYNVSIYTCIQYSTDAVKPVIFNAVDASFDNQ